MYSAGISDERENKGAGCDCRVGMSASDLASCSCQEAPQLAWLLADLGDSYSCSQHQQDLDG